MKEKETIFKVNGKEYKAVFNLNVMQEIQIEYETFANWGELTDGKKGETDIKALIFGIKEMLNEAIDIENEELEEKKPFLTAKQVGRLITEIGIQEATRQLNQTVIDSTKDDEPKKRVIHEEEENSKIDFSWFSFIGVCKLHFTEKEVFRMTLRKFNKLWGKYKIYHDLEKKYTYQQLEQAQADDDEWL